MDRVDKKSGRIRLYFLSLVVLMLGFAGVAEAAISIGSATWSATSRSGRLAVSGAGSSRYTTVTIYNAVTGSRITSVSADRSGSWSVSSSLSLTNAPCRIRATSSRSTEGSAEMDVANAPTNCVGSVKQNQAPLTVTATPTSIAVGGSSTLSTTGGSGTGLVTYAATGNTTSTICTINGSTLTASGSAGSCSVTATKAGDTNYIPITSAAVSVQVTAVPEKQNQAALSVTANPNPVTIGSSSALGTNGGSGTGAVSFTASATVGLTCAVNGSTLTPSGTPGTCTVTATKAGDSTYNPATSSPFSVQVKANQANLTISANPTSVALGGSSQLTLGGGSGTGAVTYQISASGPTCQISGTTLNVSGATGNCSVTANKAGDTSYNPATSNTVIITVTKANQAALTLNPGTTTLPVLSSTNLDAIGGSGTGTVTYAAVASGGVSCGINGSVLTPTNGTGTCSVTATKAGDNDYLPATSPAVIITVTKAEQAALLVVPGSKTIINGGRGTGIAAEGGSSAGAVSYAVTGSSELTCSISNAMLFASGGTGTCSVTATMKGNSMFNDITSAAAVVYVANLPNVSINSTSRDSTDVNLNVVPEQSRVNVGTSGSYSILAVNDLGMHCVDLDARIVNILPPFQVLLGQVVQKGTKPVLYPKANPSAVQLSYSSASTSTDPILTQNVFNGVKTDGTTYKLNFWDNVKNGGYDAFYPGFAVAGAGYSISSLVPPDMGLLVPNAERFYLDDNGQVISNNGVLGDKSRLAVSQQAMPGAQGAYAKNEPQLVQEHYTHKPFFASFPFGYFADNVNWFEAPGIPMAPYDDFGRQNPYPLVRVQAKNGAGQVLATVDTVLPVSAESSCTNCHGSASDVIPNVQGSTRRTTTPIDQLTAAGLAVASSADDPQGTLLPKAVSVEYGTDVNILRLHDLKHGSKYVFPTEANKTGVNQPCNIKAGLPDKSNGDANCLSYKAVELKQPVVCQSCHYTPALDLLQAGPQSGPKGDADANGRNQLAHQSNSRVMHGHHGKLEENGKPLFTPIDAPVQGVDASGNGIVTNQAVRLQALEENCYQCHPGKETKCLRGAMFNGGMLCSDCHGSIQQVGNDFTRDVTTKNPMPGALAKTLGTDFYLPGSTTPRVPWGNEPGCGSCHTGDAVNNVVRTNGNAVAVAGTVVNAKDSHGVVDNIRLRQAFLTQDPKATPIVPANKTFAEPVVPDSFNGFKQASAGNPKLYRVSSGHGGVMCEGCHGPTHAEWPNKDPNSNDNTTANQLQGHSGVISECSTCHTTSGMSSKTQSGPHGMHLVNDSRFYLESHKDMAKTENRKANGGTCSTCHGMDHRGTVLSRAPVDRAFSNGRKVAAGKPVACDLCHSLSKSLER